MKQNYKIKFLPLFEHDLRSVTNYISYKLHNPLAALTLTDAVQQAITERAYAPESFEPYPSKKERDIIYYRIQVKNYEIFYVVIDDIMEIRRFAYKRRHLKSTL